MQKVTFVRSYEIDGLFVVVTVEKRADIMSEIYFSINGNERFFVWSVLYPSVTRKWVKNELKTYGRAQIEFTADNSQYFTGRRSRDGFHGPFIGVGENEAEAYEDAASMAYGALDMGGWELPKKRGNGRKGLAHYFGRETAAECRKYPDHDLQIICIVYVPKIF